MISKAERQYIAQGLAFGVRADGRACHDYRPIQLELAVVPQANGSARCLIGDSEVLVAVKVKAANDPRPAAVLCVLDIYVHEPAPHWHTGHELAQLLLSTEG